MCSLAWHANFTASSQGRNPRLRTLNGHVQCEVYVRGHGYMFLDVDENVFYLDAHNKRLIGGDEVASDHYLGVRDTPGSLNVGLFGRDDDAIEFAGERSDGLERGQQHDDGHAHHMDLTLRPSERLVLRWDNVGRWAGDSMLTQPKQGKKGLADARGSPTAERASSAKGKSRQLSPFLGNSRIEYRPVLTSEGKRPRGSDVVRALGSQRPIDGKRSPPRERRWSDSLLNVKRSSNGLKLLDPRRPGSAIFISRSPWVMTGGELYMTFGTSSQSDGTHVRGPMPHASGVTKLANVRNGSTPGLLTSSRLSLAGAATSECHVEVGLPADAPPTASTGRSRREQRKLSHAESAFYSSPAAQWTFDRTTAYAGPCVGSVHLNLDEQIHTHTHPGKYAFAVRISMNATTYGTARASSHLRALPLVRNLTLITHILVNPFSLPSMRLGVNEFHYRDDSPAGRGITSDEVDGRRRDIIIEQTWRQSADDAVLPVAPPRKPIGPTDGQDVATSQLSFAWPSCRNATAYHLLVSRRADMRLPYRARLDTLVQSPALSIGSHSLGLFSPGVRYYWRVRAREKHGLWGEWSPTWSFRFRGPGVPVNVSLRSDGCRNATLTWAPSVRPGLHEDPVAYEIYGSNETGFAPGPSNLLARVDTASHHRAAHGKSTRAGTVLHAAFNMVFGWAMRPHQDAEALYPPPPPTLSVSPSAHLLLRVVVSEPDLNPRPSQARSLDPSLDLPERDLGFVLLRSARTNPVVMAGHRQTRRPLRRQYSCRSPTAMYLLVSGHTSCSRP